MSLDKRQNMWYDRYADAFQHKCCGNCAFYKRDYKCLKEPDAYISSTSQSTRCRDWKYVEPFPSRK